MKILITSVGPLSVARILSYQVNMAGKYFSSSDVIWFQKWSLKKFLNFYANLISNANFYAKNFVILLKSKLHFAHLYAYLAGSANVNFCKSHPVYKLLIKDKEKILPAKYPIHLGHNAEWSEICLPVI